MASFDHSKLAGRIKEMCGTQSTFGKKMGWSHTTTTAKINGESALTQDEIAKAVKILEIPKTQIPVYFFTPKVQKN